MRGDQVAESVRDPLAVDLLHRLHDVRMVTDHQVDVAVGKQLRSDLPLLVVELVRVLRAPMATDQRQVGAAVASLLSLELYCLRADRAGPPGLAVRVRQPVESEGETERRDLHSPD